MSKRVVRVAITLAAALLLTACGAGPAARPDLARLYSVTSSTRTQPPVIVIHGVLGSKLRRADGREVWPGGLSRLAFSSYPELALEIDPVTLEPRRNDLEPFAIFDSAAGNDFYGAILSTLENAGGYHRGVPGTPAVAGEKRDYVFLYDWRRDDVETAAALGRLIAQIRSDYGDPTLQVDIVAHSNGGLVARYYARYGARDVCDGDEFRMDQAGAADIRRLILLGTPNFGSVRSLTGLIDGAEVGFRKIPPEVLATMPSAYQLLPHALNTWIVDRDGQDLDDDIFSVDTWKRYRWSIFDPAVRQRVIAAAPEPATGEQRLATLERYFEKRLERARRFSWSLSVADTPGGVRPIVFGGDCELTPARVLIEDEGGDAELRFYPKDIRHPRPGVDYGALLLEPGDGTVTKASLLARDSLDPSVKRHEWSHFPLDYAFFLCERHDRLTGNPSFQDNLLQALLSVDR